MARDTEVALGSLSKNQQFRFLSICGIDFESARQAIKLARMQLGQTPMIKGIVFNAFSELAVVRYSRPFAASKIVAGKKTRLPSTYLDVLSPVQRALHAKLYKLRNTTAAHTQAHGRRMQHIRIPGLYGKDPQTISLLRIRCATEAQLSKMIGMIDALDAELRKHRDPLAPKV